MSTIEPIPADSRLETACLSRQRPTICQVVHSLRVGGAERLAVQLARGLAVPFRFVFVTLDEAGPLGETLERAGIPVATLLRRPGLDLSCAHRLACLLRAERVDLVHAHQYTPFVYSALARSLGGDQPILFTEHGRHFPDAPKRKRILANRFLLQSHDRIVGVGQAVRAALIQNEGFAPHRVAVIPNGIDETRFLDRASQRETMRRRLGLPDSVPVLIQVARLDPLKDHATALRAFARLRHRHPTAVLLLVGEGPEEPAIREQIVRLGLDGSVRLLGLRTDIPELLAVADVALLSSLSEGVPLSLLEAMAASLPIVATAVGGTPAVVEPGQTGWLVPPGDSEALAGALGRVLDDPLQAARMGRRGCDRVRAEFTEARMQTRYAQFYREMLHV